MTIANYETAALLGELIVGRNPEWFEVALRTTGAAAPVSVKDLPASASAGVNILNSPKTRVVVDLREDVARYGHRVRVVTADDSATYTVTIDSLAYDYAAQANDTAADILAGLAAAINAGVSLGSITLTFADANPDTITRSAGDWTAANVGANTQLIVSNAAGLNDGKVFTNAAAPTATVVTCIATDAVVAEATTAYTVVARQQVQAVVETRDGVPTLVITTLIGSDQNDVIDADLDGADLELLADESTVQTITVGSTGTGALEIDKDATTCDVDVYFTARGSNPPGGWRSPNELQFAGLVATLGFDERLDSAGCARCDLAIRNADGIVAGAWIGYAVQETS